MNFEMIMIVVIGLLNVYSCVLFYRDKKFAQTNQYRISESRLLRASFLLGGVGAYLGMQVFRHKTKHRKFQILVPVAAVFTVVVWGWLVMGLV